MRRPTGNGRDGDAYSRVTDRQRYASLHGVAADVVQGRLAEELGPPGRHEWRPWPGPGGR